MNALRCSLVALLALCLCACLPVTTKTAVGETAGFVNDPALTGTWAGHFDKDSPDVTFFHFIPRDDNTITFIGVSTPQKDTTGGWGWYAVTTATLGGHRYLNARDMMDDGKPAPPEAQKNIPMLYTIKGDTLTLYLLDEDLTTKAIEAHVIAGDVVKGQYTTDVTITADAAALDAFLKTDAGAKLFTPFVVLHRVVQ